MELNKNRKERKEKNELKDSKIYTLANTHTHRATDRESRKKKKKEWIVHIAHLPQE